GAAGDRHRRGCRATPSSGHRGLLRHAGGDRLRPGLHPDLLRRLPQPWESDRPAARPPSRNRRSSDDPCRIGDRMTFRRFSFSTLSALALSGCAVGPDYVAAVPPPASSGPFLSADDPAFAAQPLPADWW